MADGTKIMLISNKADLENEREVPCKVGKKFAMENQMCFFEVSAKTGENVNKAFEHLANRLVEQTKIDDEYKSYVQ